MFCPPKKSENIPFINVQIPLDMPVEIANNSSICPISIILRQIRPNWRLEKSQFEVFTNGTTNKIFSVKNDDDAKDAEKLLFRIFGAGTDQIIDRRSELLAFERLAQAGLAPQIHGRFQNGLVCGFVPGKCLTIESVRNPAVVDLVCREMARMHKIPLNCDDPCDSSPIFPTKTKQWLATLSYKFSTDHYQRQFDAYFGEFDLYDQFSRLQTALERINSPLVFCHNDLCIFNVLLDKSSEKAHFIDYEYAAPNYQLFDIGNHFCEYAGLDNPNYEKDGPTDAERKHFIARYFFYFNGIEPKAEELDKLLIEVLHFEAVNLSRISFDYMHYAISRHSQFARIFARLSI